MSENGDNGTVDIGGSSDQLKEDKKSSNLSVVNRDSQIKNLGEKLLDQEAQVKDKSAEYKELIKKNEATSDSWIEAKRHARQIELYKDSVIENLQLQIKDLEANIVQEDKDAGSDDEISATAASVATQTTPSNHPLSRPPWL
ncbi:hypothetical protein F53441_4220 [Fusarium austroafricanum]|uniref:Uncharacterized protein n=1 Tax=Fusarium austroafricanum TaxID=2364996 RepID=A0A8H4KNS2_9HYPO|nr:hypothetical protein F53441_4220 [Fusarium austroafricanum]